MGGVLAALGSRVAGVTLAGSLAAGDFCPDRSDLDVLVVLTEDPDESMLDKLRQVHDDVVVAFRQWRDRIEAEYLTPAAVSAVQRGEPEPHPMVRISPGEPIHLTPATRHYLVNWHGAHTSGRSLHGAAAADLLPPIGDEEMLAVVAEHLANWPEWILDHHAVGAQAYAVLTVCRGRAALATRRQVSKRGGAQYGIPTWPQWRELVEWARDWWFCGGSDQEPSRYAEVVAFVRDVA